MSQAGRVAQVVKVPAYKCEALSSTPVSPIITITTAAAAAIIIIIIIIIKVSKKKEKILGTDDFTGEFYKTIKEE
jgi:hypothetical protein